MMKTPGTNTPRRFCAVETGAGGRDLVELALRYLPEGQFEKVFIKPNWVLHQTEEAFPIAALVTAPEVLDALIAACLAKYPSLKRIVVGDVPLQACDWDLLLQQAGIGALKQKYESREHPLIRFLDLRRERFRRVGGFLEPACAGSAGDPLGYAEIALDEESFLEEISDPYHLFRVSDYDPKQTISRHRRGFHRYLIARSALDCDLFINVPKMKAHQKAGITGALKNLVGINGEKAYLVHYRLGGPSRGGDEFPPETPSIVVAQARIREALQKRWKGLFRAGALAWRLARMLWGIEVNGTPGNLSKRFYRAGGGWFGNDTIWRMVYDLNRIVRYAPAEGGRLKPSPQRAYLAVLDAIVAGEGNGPLQPLPVATDAVVFSDDPFLMDTAMSALMGFDYRKIPVLKNMERFGDKDWGAFDPEEAAFCFDGALVGGAASLPVLYPFRPAPGWRGHIERVAEEAACRS